MRIISADFNARTESGHLCLNSRGAQEDLRDQGVQVGGWMWLSDGELVVGAQLASDDRYGPVGVPHWNTLVHLDDDDSRRTPRLPGVRSSNCLESLAWMRMTRRVFSNH